MQKHTRGEELFEKRQLSATSGHVSGLNTSRKMTCSSVILLLLLAVACGEGPAKRHLSDLQMGVAEVLEAGARQAWLPLGGSAAIEITSPQNGATYPLQTPATPVTVAFALTDWPAYPGTGYAVNVYVDNAFVGASQMGDCSRGNCRRGQRRLLRPGRLDGRGWRMGSERIEEVYPRPKRGHSIGKRGKEQRWNLTRECSTPG